MTEGPGDEPGSETLQHARAFVSFSAALMATDISTTTTELPESRVRVEAEVGPGEVERRMTQAAKVLARNIRVPGFRAGKAPPPVVIKRVGREAVLDEAVRESLGSWYRAAIDDAHVVPVGEPEIDMSELPKEGEPLKFSIEIGVRPKAELGEYKGLEVGKREADVSDEAVAEEVDRLRERAAKLEPVERQAQRGDFVVMDFEGTLDGVPFAGGEGRDQMIELGSGRLVPGFEEQLEGAVAGQDLTVTVTFPDDYGSDELAGEVAEFAVTVREVKAKQLPELNDELAEEAGFDTLDELRADIRSRMAEAETSPDRGRVPRGGAGRRGRGRDDRGAGRADRGAGARAVGLDAAPALAPGHRSRDLPAHLRPLGGGHDRAGQAGRRAGAQARGRAGRGGRGRVARADRGRDARGGRRGVTPGGQDVTEEAAGAPAFQWAHRQPQGRPVAAQGTGSARGVGEAGSGHRAARILTYPN